MLPVLAGGFNKSRGEMMLVALKLFYAVRVGEVSLAINVAGLRILSAGLRSQPAIAYDVPPWVRNYAVSMDFSLWGLVLARTKPHRLKSVLLALKNTGRF
jgi:hypothetical protein